MSRDERNKDLVERMRRGEPLQDRLCPFPPRPIILKDFKSLAKIYGVPNATDERETDIGRTDAETDPRGNQGAREQPPQKRVLETVRNL